jgi:polysaccharide biosynthesis transport protein
MPTHIFSRAFGVSGTLGRCIPKYENGNWLTMDDPVPLNAFTVGSDQVTDPAASFDSLATSFDALKNFLRRNWKLITLTAIVGLALGWTSLVLRPARYESAAVILIDKPRVHFFGNQSVITEATIETLGEMEGQLEILKSDVIAKRVIQKLGLAKDADFLLPRPPALFSALGIAREVPLTEAQRERHLLNAFAASRTVTRIGSAHAAEVGFKSHSPTVAAAVANAIVDEYMADTRSSGRTAARDVGDWLQERLTELRARTAEAEQAVVDFKTKNNIIDVEGKQIVGQQIAEISSQLTKARSQLSDVSARLERALASAREYATSPVKPAMPEMLNNPVSNKLQEQYLELSRLAAEYAERFGADHQATLKLRQRMQEVKVDLVEDIERLSQSLLSDKKILEKRVEDLEAALKASAGSSHANEKDQIRLRQLESAAQSYRALYDGLLRRHSEVRIQEEQPMTTGARILSPASEPLSSTDKKSLLFAAMLALGTTGLGVALSFLREVKDRTFRTSDDIQRRLKGDFIAMIPMWRPSAQSRRLSNRRELVTTRHAHGSQLREDNTFWAFMISPTSTFAEAIGRVKFAILRHAEASDSRIIGFTSVLPNEGASTIAASVVQSLPKSGRTVILVDCDLRHPALTKEIAPKAKIGLQEVLLGTATLDEAILTDEQNGIAFLPGIVDNLEVRPEELLEMPELAKVLTELRQHYDYVIVDLPPLFPMLDVSITDRLIETFIIVVEWGSSKIDTVAHALARCPGVHKRMLGFVLNKVDFGRLSLYDLRAADYYDERRYSNYVLRGAPK